MKLYTITVFWFDGEKSEPFLVKSTLSNLLTIWDPFQSQGDPS